MKPYESGMICGRFQHVHVGHKSMVDTARMLCDRVVILVGSSQEYGTERNPFDIETRIKMLREVLGNDENIIIKPLADLSHEGDISPDWGRYVLDNCKRYIHKAPEVMIYGNDPEREAWFDPKDTTNTTMVSINRNKIAISATALRTLMAQDNREEWMKWVDPRLHKHYDRLRSELMTINYYKELGRN